MTTLKDIRDKIRDYQVQHQRQPMNERQFEAVLAELLRDLQDLEAEDGDS